ncbi:YIP1 family protein [Paenibacillus mendelii]|uniref:YIP1 family protein n=1 Tax=Paenibacillus mendelii TaxID=206163 RepID=A0ABV6JJR2_9BACL|nr:YIP1 family protein [Paenibacillus mendelii]MCQ6559089.1 YIP1 family protein [Paenibacillus mendelii]
MGELVIHLKQAIRILRHPVDGFWELRYEKRGSLISALILLLLAYLATLISEISTSFIFNPIEIKFINPWLVLAQVSIPWLTWVLANYLVSSINRGQGRLLDVMIGSAYALVPYIFFTIPLSLVSNVLTIGESSIYMFFHYIIIGWTGFLFIVLVQEIHNYDIGETIWITVLSVLFMLAIWILLLIFAGLSVQLVDFIEQLYEEVSFR